MSSAAHRGRGSSPRGGGIEDPSTQTLETLRDRLPLSIRLIGRGSRASAALVLAIAVVFVGLVPLAAKLQLNAAQSTGMTVAVGEAVTFTVANDWSVASQDGRATILTSGSSRLVMVPAYETELIPAAIAASEISTVAADAASAWVVGEPTRFRTDSGASGAVVAASSETAATQVWAVTSDGVATVAVLSTTIESWATVQPQVQQMVESIEFDGAGDGDTP